MRNEIRLDEKQEDVRKKLLDMVLDIEKCMNTTIDTQNGEECAHQLALAIQFLSTTGLIMQYASTIYDFAKGEAAKSIMTNPMAMEAKYEVQKYMMAGMLARYSGIFERSERVCKDLNNYCDGLRTIISLIKETNKLLPIT